MHHKLDRTIAALEVEAKMLEAHAEKLSIMARQLPDLEHQREIMKLSHEETENAEVYGVKFASQRYHPQTRLLELVVMSSVKRPQNSDIG